MSDELERRLRRARPRTSADDGWAASPAGTARLAAIRATVGSAGADGVRMRVLLRRPRAVRVAAAAVVSAAAAISVVGLPSTGSPDTPPAASPRMALSAFPDCAAMVRALREHTASHVTRFGLSGRGGFPYASVDAIGYAPNGATLVPTPARIAASPVASHAAPSVQTHSTTNDQVAGVDEPDVIKTDGSRVVAMSHGVLRVVDVATQTVAGRLDLRSIPGAFAAQLLLSGDRVLVVVPQPVYVGGPALFRGGPDVRFPVRPAGGYGERSTLVLVDVSSAPRIISTLHVQGSYVDARMSGGVVRVVVDSQPRLPFRIRSIRGRKLRANRRVVRHAPLSDWLPRYSVTAEGVTTQHRVACTDVAHPVRYTGADLLTVYSVDMAQGLGDVAPVSVATDAATVYGTASDLFIAATPRYGQPEARTQIHRFDISRPGRPVYLGSGTVSGQLLNSYALDSAAGHLRVVTTVPRHRRQPTSHPGGDVWVPSTTRVTILDETSMRVMGTLDGLGRGEQVEAVRFAGPTAYVVTYRSLDPLYVLDLTDPKAPRETGELSVTGYSDYLHPLGNGRLLGVGRSVRGNEPIGVQLSLFDVSDPATPRRLARVIRPGASDAVGANSHAFLYWAPTGTAVVPLQEWGSADAGAALVLHVDGSSLRVVGTIGGRHSGAGWRPVTRSLVVGSQLWAFSSHGFDVYDISSLRQVGAVPFR